MKMLMLLMLIGSTLMPAQGRGQAAWLTSLKIRQSFADDENKQNPALFSLTIPKEKKASYLADLGLGYELPSLFSSVKMTGTAIVEYHRTNLSDGEMNNLQLGYANKWVFTAPPVVPPVLGAVADYRTLQLNSTVKYRRDKVEGSHGAAATAMLTFFQQGNGHRIWWNSAKFSASKRFHYLLNPQLGVELQENFHADSTVDRGFTGRTVAGLAVGFGGSKPNPAAPASPIGIGIWLFSIDAALRYDAVRSGNAGGDRLHPLIKANLDFFILYKPVKLSIGAKYVYGDNPIEGFKEFKFKPQQFLVIALKVQK